MAIPNYERAATAAEMVRVTAGLDNSVDRLLAGNNVAGNTVWDGIREIGHHVRPTIEQVSPPVIKARQATLEKILLHPDQVPPAAGYQYIDLRRVAALSYITLCIDEAPLRPEVLAALAATNKSLYDAQLLVERNGTMKAPDHIRRPILDRFTISPRDLEPGIQGARAFAERFKPGDAFLLDRVQLKPDDLDRLTRPPTLLQTEVALHYSGSRNRWTYFVGERDFVGNSTLDQEYVFREGAMEPGLSLRLHTHWSLDGLEPSRGIPEDPKSAGDLENAHARTDLADDLNAIIGPMGGRLIPPTRFFIGSPTTDGGRRPAIMLFAEYTAQGRQADNQMIGPQTVELFNAMTSQG